MIYYRGCFISYWFWKALENMVVRSLTVFLFFFCKTFFVILFFQNIIVKGGYHLPKKKGKEKKETVSSDITQWIYPWELGRLHRRKKKSSISPLGAGCRFCNRDAHHSKCKPMRKRERALELYRLPLSLFLWQHGSCTLTNSAAWKIPVVDYILPLNLECAKTFVHFVQEGSLIS